jgi:hypothetical protein
MIGAGSILAGVVAIVGAGWLLAQNTHGPGTGNKGGNPTPTPTAPTTPTETSTLPAQPLPTITDFQPRSGKVGTPVTITGFSFTGVTAVAFNATLDPAFTVINATMISATVPAGATSGPLGVTTPNGTVTSNTSFVVTSG